MIDTYTGIKEKSSDFLESKLKLLYILYKLGLLKLTCFHLCILFFPRLNLVL